MSRVMIVCPVTERPVPTRHEAEADLVLPTKPAGERIAHLRGMRTTAQLVPARDPPGGPAAAEGATPPVEPRPRPRSHAGSCATSRWGDADRLT